MQTAEFWKSLFENWPDAIERQGIVLSKNGETTPFINFMISGGLLLLERSGPDAGGARKVVISYEAIELVKLSTATELSKFQSMGFRPPA